MKQQNTIHILLYHHIYEGNKDNPDKGSISINNFTDQIESLEKYGFKNLSLQEAFPMIINNIEPEQNSYVITFDDAFESVSRFMPEIINKIKPTVFVITDYTGKVNMWNTRATEKLSHMKLADILKLKNSSVDFQFHGTNHHNLVKFNENELKDQFKTGIEWFNRNLGFSPDFIAYPYGSFKELVVKVSAKYFKGGLSVNHGYWEGHEARYKLNRISVPGYLSGKQLCEILNNRPDNIWLALEKMAPWVR